MTYPASPDILFGQLFTDVQLGHVFPDSKTFVDCTPRTAPMAILAQYETQKTELGFDLIAFVHAHFELPEQVGIGPSHGGPSHGDYVSDTTISTTEHINRLWDRLTRPADVAKEHSSRVPLPHPYVVPGGRFREIFYWDSYFTMLGLKEVGRVDLIRDMVDNFAYLIDTVGFIPNGNRTYFLSRSQPPFFALMVELLAEIDGREVLVKYLPQLQKEWEFWIESRGKDQHGYEYIKRHVPIANGNGLTTYWDELHTARPESYRQEIELLDEANRLDIVPEQMFNHIRVACESGWDFSSRWFADGKTLATIQAGKICPVDLNCLLYGLEKTLQKAYFEVGQTKLSTEFESAAFNREEFILDQCWNVKTAFFHDFSFNKQFNCNHTEALTLAGAFPLFFNLATPEQATHVHDRLKADFLQASGWVTTLNQTGQQWDWPNGWAPLQWIVYKGLMNYGFAETAREGRDRWLALNDKVFKATGKMMEKYNVVDETLTTGGGEYPNQDGFGWTNGVYLALSADRKLEQQS